MQCTGAAAKVSQGTVALINEGVDAATGNAVSVTIIIVKRSIVISARPFLFVSDIIIQQER